MGCGKEGTDRGTAKAEALKQGRLSGLRVSEEARAGGKQGALGRTRFEVGDAQVLRGTVGHGKKLGYHSRCEGLEYGSTAT